MSAIQRVCASIIQTGVKPCPHWRHSATVTENGDSRRIRFGDFGDKLSPKSATIVSSVDRLLGYMQVDATHDESCLSNSHSENNSDQL